jgi:dTMP kinase
MTNLILTAPIIVILDAPDGAGKTILAKRVAEKLESFGRRVAQFRDPGGTPAAEKIRALVKSAETPMHPEAQCLLFCAARADLAAEIRKCIDGGQDVVLDRWWYSMYAYQGAAGISVKAIRDLVGLFGKLPYKTPRLVAYYLHVTPATSRQRIRESARVNEVAKDRFEGKPGSYQDEVYWGYEHLAESGEMTRVETEGLTLDDVFAALWGKIAINQLGLSPETLSDLST